MVWVVMDGRAPKFNSRNESQCDGMMQSRKALLYVYPLPLAYGEWYEISIETSLADWYKKPDRTKNLRELDTKYHLTDILAGNLSQLLEEFERPKPL